MKIKNLVPNSGDNVLLLAACEISNIMTLEGVYYLVSLLNDKGNISITKIKIINKYDEYTIRKRIPRGISDIDILFLFYEKLLESSHVRLRTEVQLTKNGLIKRVFKDEITRVKDYYNNSSYTWEEAWQEKETISKTTLPLIKIDTNIMMIKESLHAAFKNMDRETKNLFMV